MRLRQAEMKVTRQAIIRVRTGSKVCFEPRVNRIQSLKARREVLD
jgi:hypothetical protein